ncbi:KH domain-containing protein akap-1-like isoform X1 [Palaemon carinicauda]|uniref:KH domain-containing protein akap-1-like isoform X1 n=2 Tax=Palaemon carinicauda TaxID=392227 RepID=UPI0035B598B3
MYFEMKFALGAAAAITGASALIYLLLRPRKRRLDPGKQKSAMLYAAAFDNNAAVSCREETELPVKSGDNALPLRNLNGHVSMERAASGTRGRPDNNVEKGTEEELQGCESEKDFSLDNDINDIRKRVSPLVEKDFSLDDKFEVKPIEQVEEPFVKLPQVASSPAPDVSTKPDEITLADNSNNPLNDSSILLDNSSNSLHDSSNHIEEPCCVAADVVEDRTALPSLEEGGSAIPSSETNVEISKTCQSEVSQEAEALLKSQDKPESDQVEDQAASLSSDVLYGESKSSHEDSCIAVPSCEEAQTLQLNDATETVPSDIIASIDGSLATTDSDSVPSDSQNVSSKLLEGGKLDGELEPAAAMPEVVKEVEDSIIHNDNAPVVGERKDDSLESVECKEEPVVKVSQLNVQNSSVSEENPVPVESREPNEEIAVSKDSGEVTANSSFIQEKAEPESLPIESAVSSTSTVKSEESVTKEDCVQKPSELVDESKNVECVESTRELCEEVCVEETIAETLVSAVNEAVTETETIADVEVTTAKDSPSNLEDCPEDKTEKTTEVSQETKESQDGCVVNQDKEGCVSVDTIDSPRMHPVSDENKSQIKTDVPEREEVIKAAEADSKQDLNAKATKESSPSSETDSEGRRSYKGRVRNARGDSTSSVDEKSPAEKKTEEAVCEADKDLCSYVEDGVGNTDKWTVELPSRVPNTEANKDPISSDPRGEAAVVSSKDSNKTTIKDSNKSSKGKKESTDNSKSKSYKDRIRNAQGSEKNRKSETKDRTLDNNDRNLRSSESSQSSITEVEPETLFNPSGFPVTSQETFIFYEFEIPQVLVGRLIGKKGAFVNKIKAATDASIIVGPHRNRVFKMCSVEGTKSQVEAALDMIREYFPINRYPELTLAQVHGRSPAQPPAQSVINNQAMQIEIAMGVVVEVRVSAVASGNEVWVQQPLHPSYSALQRLQACMNLNYADGSTTPQIPGPIPERTVCVAQIDSRWYRCQVLNSTEDTVLVVLLDVGGALTVPASSLRQIRRDYATLPFQATQCLLHGIQPTSKGGWDDTSTAVLEELVSGVILSATVASYTPDGVPLVNLYRYDQKELIFVNERLVTLGHAQWIAPTPSS